MANKAGETYLEYTKIYVDNVEVASADITVSSATPTVVAIPACTVGQIVFYTELAFNQMNGGSID